MMSHKSDSSTMLNTLPRGPINSSASDLKVAITDGEVWMNAICLVMLFTPVAHAAEEIFGADLSALEGDFDPIGRRAGRGCAAERRTARQFADHLERLDIERPRDLARSIAARNEHATDLHRLNHVAHHFSECVARPAAPRVYDGAATAANRARCRLHSVGGIRETVG